MDAEQRAAAKEVETGLARLAKYRAELRERGFDEARIERVTGQLALRDGGVPAAIALLREIHPTGPILDEWDLVP